MASGARNRRVTEISGFVKTKTPQRLRFGRGTKDAARRWIEARLVLEALLQLLKNRWVLQR